MNSVLSDYINDNDNLRGKVSVVTSKLNNSSQSEKNRIRFEIVKIVKTGRPILMGGNGYTDSNNNGIQDSNESSFGHVVAAYEYDEENDILYGNMGWSSSSQAHRNLDKYFNIQMSNYWALNIFSTMPKSLTNNYIFIDKIVIMLLVLMQYIMLLDRKIMDFLNHMVVKQQHHLIS